MIAWLRLLIVRAAPTCTLWEQDFNGDFLRFRFNRHWVVTAREYVEAGR